MTAKHLLLGLGDRNLMLRGIVDRLPGQFGKLGIQHQVADFMQQASDEQTRVWNERFYLLLIPLMLLLLPRFRRGVFGRGVNP